ncbi:MAG: FMN-binding negative transcriptional regulator [Rhodospirillales bacterium]|jgi:transcriptional regulator
MYVPEIHAEERLDILQTVMRDHGWALLVGEVEGAPCVTHLPFMLDENRGENGTLVSHMAKNNLHWQSFEKDKEVLVVFWGPHAYISPSWYEKHPSVPTWNYVTVHAYGTPKIIEDETAKMAAQKQLVETYEGVDGWKLEDQPDKYIRGMLTGIVSFEIPISRLEGKFKMSQNRHEDDIPGIIDGLRARSEGDDLIIADMLEK